MKLETLKKKYPKAFQLWINSSDSFQNFKLSEMDVRDAWKEIVDFMDNQKIFIEVTYDRVCDVFDYCVNNMETRNHECDYDFSSRKEAEATAIKCAFEILNKRK